MRKENFTGKVEKLRSRSWGKEKLFCFVLNSTGFEMSLITFLRSTWKHPESDIDTSPTYTTVGLRMLVYTGTT